MLSSVAVFRFWSFSKENNKSKTVKMLAQDGTLVEVDASLLKNPKRKVSKDEIQNWIKK